MNHSFTKISHVAFLFIIQKVYIIVLCESFGTKTKTEKCFKCDNDIQSEISECRMSNKKESDCLFAHYPYNHKC